jgi:hypothetical protein
MAAPITSVRNIGFLHELCRILGEGSAPSLIEINGERKRAPLGRERGSDRHARGT